MKKSFREWLAEGESLYTTALSEFQELEQQLKALEEQIAGKRAEVDEIAKVVGKPALEISKRMTAEIIEAPAIVGVVGSVTRALTGRSLGR